MKKNNIITAASIVLFLAGISHLIRIFYGWDMTISKLELPNWVSFIATIILLFLSYSLLKIRNS